MTSLLEAVRRHADAHPGDGPIATPIPGLMVVLCQMMATMLSATAIVREKENGTLEQLFMTPVRAAELLLGKMLPYALLTGLEFCFIALLMRTLFAVPVHGVFFTLLALAVPFVLTMLGLGLLISSRAASPPSRSSSIRRPSPT